MVGERIYMKLLQSSEKLLENMNANIKKLIGSPSKVRSLIQGEMDYENITTRNLSAI